jgi:RNA polymerase sigma-70 factor (ECF subfamily)
MQAPYEAAMHSVEADLIARCQRGDLDAFGVVYSRYERQVFRYAFHLLGHREDADDVKQETFLKAWQHIGSFRREASLQTWLLKICGNLCRDKMRSWERRKVHSESEMATVREYPAGEESDPAYIAERSQTAATILKAMQGLPAPLREAFVLHEVEGLDYDAMAGVLGCTRASVKLRVFRARQTLKERVHSLLKVR